MSGLPKRKPTDQRSNFIVPGKLDYVRGKRPPVGCILCAVAQGSKKVVDFRIYATRRFIVSLNLYPYNPGHLMLFPRRHLLGVAGLTDGEAKEMFRLIVLCQKVLSRLYAPEGFNVGWNQGGASGASIQHLHVHIVPRYANEIGIMDILSGTRVLVEEPGETIRRIRAEFARTTRKRKT